MHSSPQSTPHTHTRAAQPSRRVTRARTITILACYCPDEVAMSADSRIIKFGFYDHEEFEERGRKKHRARCKFCKPSTPFGGQTVRPDCAIQHSMPWPRMFFLCQLAVLRWREFSAMEDWSWGHIAPNFPHKCWNASCSWSAMHTFLASELLSQRTKLL